ncbi:uncharacterized protein [Ciconia boyciana]|uniref:uncharacterized protein n=1 Tax=Ciconia boyciana TaxID=52775 RepID=UPI003BA13D81
MMAPGLGPWLLALSLAAGPAGVWAQLRLVEAGGGLRVPGDSVLLSCRGSGFTFENYEVLWYRQAPGGSLDLSHRQKVTGKELCTTCHPQGQLHSPGSTLLFFLGGRSSVVLETHITFCPPEVFLPSKQLRYCTLQGERHPGVHQQLQLLLLLQPPLLAFTVVIDRGTVSGQVALEQRIRELAVREGDGVTFQCSMSGDSMSRYYTFWYRQRPRGTLDWIYEAGDAYGEGFQDRFKGTVESSQNRFTLQMQAAKQGDEAVYYCGAGLTLEQLCSRVDQNPTDRE